MFTYRRRTGVEESMTLMTKNVVHMLMDNFSGKKPLDFL